MIRRKFLLVPAVAACAPWAGRALAQVPTGSREWVLGMTGILNGPLGDPIRIMLAGAQLAFDAVNAQGGIHGRTIRLVTLDDGLSPEKALANYRQLLDEQGVQVFFGCVGSGTTAAAADWLKRSGVPMVGGYAVSDSAREKSHGAAYFVRATYAREVQTLVRHLLTLGVSRIAIAVLDNPGGAEVARLANTLLTQNQSKATAIVSVKDSADSIAEAGRTLGSSGSQAVIMYLGGSLAGQTMRAALNAGGRGMMFYGMSIVPGEMTAELAKQSVVIAQIVPYPWNEANAQTREYRTLATRSQVPVGYLSFEGYVNALVMIEALRRAGRDASHAQLHAALRELRMQVAGMDVDFSGGRSTGSLFVDLVQASTAGRFVR